MRYKRGGRDGGDDVRLRTSENDLSWAARKDDVTQCADTRYDHSI